MKVARSVCSCFMLSMVFAAVSRCQSAVSIEEANRLVVQVVAGSTPGSGIIVGYDSKSLFVVTANHVIVDLEAGQNPSITFRGGTKTTGSVTHQDSTMDLAVIETPRPKFSFDLAFDRLGAPAFLRLGESLYLLGHPNGRPWTLTRSDAYLGESPNVLKFDPHTLAPGDSGGALLNDQLEIVGMLKSDQTQVGEALNISAVLKRISQWSIPTSLRSRFLGADVKKFAAGGYHTCFVDGKGSTQCWGGNSQGQIGNNKFEENGRSLPERVFTQVPFVTITAGLRHTCGLSEQGAAYCWGWNEDGQIGVDSDRFAIEVPTLVKGDLRFRSISAGATHTCGVNSEGELYCWGGGIMSKDSKKPVRVSGIPELQSLVSGDGMSCGLTVTGETICWSKGQTPRRVAGAPIFRFISLQLNRLCGLNENGRAFCIWYGKPGESFRPSGVRAALVTVSPGVDVHCGLTAAGETRCWLLDGTVPKPDTVGSAIQNAFAGLKLVSISLGLNHACGLTADSSVYCQGANASGQLGDGSGDRETYDAVRVRLSP